MKRVMLTTLVVGLSSCGTGADAVDEPGTQAQSLGSPGSSRCVLPDQQRCVAAGCVWVVAPCPLATGVVCQPSVPECREPSSSSGSINGPVSPGGGGSVGSGSGGGAPQPINPTPVPLPPSGP